MRAARALTAMAAVALSSCGAPDAGEHLPHHSEKPSWPMYQYSGSRNAIFAHYSLDGDWAYDAKAKINSGLALVGNTLLFTTFSHKLIALDVRQGHELWQAQLPNVAMSTPIVAENMVFIGTGKSGILKRGFLLKMRFPGKSVWGVPGGDEIAAFDLRTGAVRWTYHTVGEDMPSPVYDDGRLIFANGDWHAYALRADTGRQLWSTDVGGVSTMASAVVAGKAVVVGVCTRGMRQSWAVALDRSTGTILWKSPYGHCDGAPAYADGKVFVSSLMPGDKRLVGRTVVAALDANTGKSVWVYRAPKLGLWSIFASDEAAIAGTYAYGTFYQPAPFTDEIIAFNAANGNVRWTFHTSGPVKMSPVITNGRVYVGDTVGLLYTLDARTGRLIELRAFRQPFTASPPVIAGNKLIIVNGPSVKAIPLAGKPSLTETAPQ